MTSHRRFAALLSVAGLMAGCPGAAHAHAGVIPYTLPVPFWLYAFAIGATLVLTFALLVIAAITGRTDSAVRSYLDRSVALNWGMSARSGFPVWASVLQVLRLAAVAALLLTIGAGLFGAQSVSQNISMPLFWLAFLLGFTYLTVLLGNIFEIINPWNTIADWLARLGVPVDSPRFAYPLWLAYWPSFVFYVGLVWLEIIEPPLPGLLSSALLIYSIVTLTGIVLFGRAAWFRYGELFSVYFRLIALVAPVEYARTAGSSIWSVRLRMPFAGTLKLRVDHLSLLLFILFMLSSTTYDGLKGTVLWRSLYWKNMLSLFEPLWGTDLAKAQELLAPGYDLYQRLGLIVSPFVYLAIYMAIIWAVKRITSSKISIGELALHFSCSVIPIVIVYNVAHYFTTLLLIAPSIPYILTDPFALGWNLLNIPPRFGEDPLDMQIVWHTELLLIVAGHIVSVYIAHLLASVAFSSRREALLSEVPLLVLMVGYTAFGLYVLSLPLALR